ncbi:unnamed protein product [Durusdinium trenchii]|uniref:Poly [ADP-ribose] polymerase n=1 Tax=Durusdinium trenchii TaxID=1381693 RepID=A0ABP0N7P6_9DINO
MGTVRVNKRIANCIRDLNDGGFFQTPLRLGVVARSLAKLDVENALQVLQGVADAASSDPSTHENPTAKVLLEASWLAGVDLTEAQEPQLQSPEGTAATCPNSAELPSSREATTADTAIEAEEFWPEDDEQEEADEFWPEDDEQEEDPAKLCEGKVSSPQVLPPWAQQVEKREKEDDKLDQEVGSVACILVTGCAHTTVAHIVRGTFTVNGQNHARPTYKKDTKVNGLDVQLYYWDGSDDPAFCGWWFGAKVGGNDVWAYAASSTLTPPKTGWRVPSDGPVDSSFLLSATDRVGQRSGRARRPEESSWIRGSVRVSMQRVKQRRRSRSSHQSRSKADKRKREQEDEPTNPEDVAKLRGGTAASSSPKTPTIATCAAAAPVVPDQDKEQELKESSREDEVGQSAMLDVERSECTASPPKPDTEPVPEAIVPAATPKATADPDDSRSKDLAEGRGSRRSRSSSSSSYSYEYSSSSSRSRSRTVQRVKVKAESTDEIPKAAPPREQRCLTSDAEKGLTIGQMVDKQIADLQDKVTRLEQALCSERGLREAADQKFRDAVQSLEGKAGECQSLQRVLASEREKLQAAQKQVEAGHEKLHAAEKKVEAGEEKLHATEKQIEVEREKLKSAEREIEQLTSRLAEQRRISSMASSCGACWQYEENGCWHAVPPEANDQMHQAYLAYLRDPSSGNRCRTINSAGVAREVDFELMQQKRGDTNKVRQIRILPDVPKQWVSTPACLLQQTDELRQFYVEETDPRIYSQVQEILQSAGHKPGCSWIWTSTIKSVHRIENLRLWQAYKLRREALRKGLASHNVNVTPADLDLDVCGAGVLTKNQSVFDCGEPLALDVDEKILLHGTSWDNANSIVLNGFDHRTCYRCMYGEGVYFASAACKSHQYTCNCRTAGCGCKRERTLILARVALGDKYYSQETRYHQRRPPVRDGTSGATYDSIVVNPGPIKGHHNAAQLHQEFVICQMEQAYPSYVIQYQL